MEDSEELQPLPLPEEVTATNLSTPSSIKNIHQNWDSDVSMVKIQFNNESSRNSKTMDTNSETVVHPPAWH
eukprot:jgi/Psemu1/2297/gm1.2297_g